MNADEDREELANLSLGRVFYSTKQYKNAIKYFEKLPGADAPRRRCARLGRVAVRGVVGLLHEGRRLQGARQHPLDQLAVLREPSSIPRRYILKAVIYFNRCNYDRSQEAINEFNADLSRRSARRSTASSRSTRTTPQFYDYVQKIRSGEAGPVGARAAAPPPARSHDARC